MTERLPPPPRPLPALRRGDVLRAPPGQTVGRIYFTTGTHPAAWDSMRSFGPVAAMRFDHHPLPARVHPVRAVAYLAPTRGRRSSNYDPLKTCVSECFGDTRTLDLRAGGPWFVLWQNAGPLRLLDVVDSSWVTRAGGNASISSGARGMSRRWARAIYRSYPDVDGIFYQSSTLPMARSTVLFERAVDALPSRYQLTLPLTHPGLRNPLKRIAHELGMGMVL
jgi:hypothetical protein